MISSGGDDCHTTNLLMHLFVSPGGDYSRGGMLRPWIVYDLRCFGVCLCWAMFDTWRLGVFTPRFAETEWQFRATLWYCKARRDQSPREVAEIGRRENSPRDITEISRRENSNSQL